MDRQLFGTGFMERYRFVLQQHDRANAVRGELADATAQLNASTMAGRATRFQEARRADLARALTAAEIGEDATITEFADYVFDAIQSFSARPIEDTSNDVTGALGNALSRSGEREPDAMGHPP